MVLPGTTGERIGDLRSGKGLSQKELAKILNITPSQMSRIENDKIKSIDSNVLIKMAKYFNVSTDFILDLTDISSQKNYEISTLGLSENAVKVFMSKSVDMQILNRVFEHKRFPVLVELIKRYVEGIYAAAFANQNEMYDFITSTIGDYAEENPEYNAEIAEDIQKIKAEKINANDVLYVQIQAIFMQIVKDVKKDVEDKKATTPLAMGSFMQGIWEQLKDKPRRDITEEDVSAATMNELKKHIKIKGTGASFFNKLITWVLKNHRKSDS